MNTISLQFVLMAIVLATVASAAPPQSKTANGGKKIKAQWRGCQPTGP